MSVDQQNTRLVQKSIVQHLVSALTTVGWTTPASWVRIGDLPINPDSLPRVAISLPERHTASYEVGSSSRRGTYLVDIEVWASTLTQLTDLMESIGENVDNMRIIDFNTAEPEDGGYDAVAQTVARGNLSDNVKTKVLDSQNFTGRVSFQLRESGPF